ncbi:MAG: hypothetical protein JW893_01240 [Candidatus Omnitrophica bacterium]|nr:hypothetical protein [Candidatus Omnitrophota bacterium]
MMQAFLTTALFGMLSVGLGYLLTAKFLPRFSGLLALTSSFLLGVLVSFWGVFIITLLLKPLGAKTVLPSFLTVLIIETSLLILFRKHLRFQFRLSTGESILLGILLASSWIIFSHVFWSTGPFQTLRISSLVVSDFAFHIPLIRSFSIGNNLDFLNPIFAHDFLRYHFLFDFMAGTFEKLGLPIGFAVALPSTLFWCAFLILLYFFGKTLFDGQSFVGWVSVLLFLFNSSLSFVLFLNQQKGESFFSILKSWWNLENYVSFGPYDGNLVCAYWHWNIYLNQRQLLLGYAVILLVLIPIISTLLKKDGSETLSVKQSVFLGFLAGILPFWHTPSYVCLLMILGILFLTFPIKKQCGWILLAAILIGAPQFLWLQLANQDQVQHSGWYFGFLVPTFGTGIRFSSSALINQFLNGILSFFRFWFYNWGLSFLLIPLSFLFVDSRRRRILLIPLALFLIAHLFRFSGDIGTNHKFLNLALIIGNCYIAFLLSRIFRNRWGGPVWAGLLFILLTASGIVDATPVKNSFLYNFADIAQDPSSRWIRKNTSTDAVFLTNYRIYNPVSLAGRTTFQGWPYFNDSLEHPVDKRVALTQKIYASENRGELCSYLRQNGIDYIQLEHSDMKEHQVETHDGLFQNELKPVFEENKSPYQARYFSREDICQGIKD